MPEGHSVHRYAQAMAELVGQAARATSPQRRFPAEAISGELISGVAAYGKNLLIDTAAGESVHVHLGMRGKWLRFSPVTGPGLPQVRLRLAVPEPQPTLAWDLIAPSRCALLDAEERRVLIASLGPDPLRDDADPAEAYARLSTFPGPIGAALLDQGRIAGVGNVFRAEILHACGIAPDRSAADLSRSEFDRLWQRLKAMMVQAVADGRIITVDADDRSAVPEDESRRVYKQRTCFDCGTPVEERVVGGRTSYSCPQCQPD